MLHDTQVLCRYVILNSKEGREGGRGGGGANSAKVRIFLKKANLSVVDITKYSYHGSKYSAMSTADTFCFVLDIRIA